MICSAVGADGVMDSTTGTCWMWSHKRQWHAEDMWQRVERIAEAAAGYKSRIVAGTRTQLAIVLHANMFILRAADHGTAELYGWRSRLK